MTARTVHSSVLNAVLATIAAFYILAPTVYGYFSEVSLSYANVPRWFAATPPARITARIFDRYNEHAPRAERFNRQLTCFLADSGGAVRRPGCLHELRAGQGAAGPRLLKIPSGRYVARFDFSSVGNCADGEARLEVVTTGRFGRLLARYHSRLLSGDHIELPFHLRVMDAAFGAVEFRAAGDSGCIVLSRVDWLDARDPRAMPLE